MVEWLDVVLRSAGLAGLAILFLAAALEYVFPPFPGDTVTVFGGVYSVRAGVSVAVVFGVLLAGSLVGAAIDYGVGWWLGRKVQREPRERRHLRFVTHDQILAWEARFRQRAAWWLAINRFLPGVRGPIFFAAGFSQIAVRRVLLWGGLSALLWNGLLFAAGYAVGGQAERLEALMRGYSRAVTLLLVAVAAVFLARALWRRRARGRPAPPPGP